jgi:hypothetical protein
MMEYARFIFLLIVTLGLFLANPDGMLVRLGFEHNVLLAIFTAVLLTCLIHDYKLVFALATLLLAAGANLSTEAALNFGFERDYAIAALLAALISPWIVRVLEG